MFTLNTGRSVSWGLFVACAVGLIGCGGGPSVPSGKVKGTVKLDGQPLADATVTFSDEKAGNLAVGDTSADGSYTLTYGGGPAVPAGTYKVRITPKEDPLPAPTPGAEKAVPKPKDSPIPAKYRSFDTSEITKEVKAGETTEHPIDLKKS